MKKNFIGVCVLSLFVVPVFLGAATLDELSSRLLSLEKRVSLLEGIAWQRWDPRISTTTSTINPQDKNTIGDFISGSWAKISGARLTKNIRIFPYPTTPTSIPYDVVGTLSTDATRLDFKLPDLPAGTYNVQLVDPTDSSRTSQMVSLRVKNPNGTSLSSEPEPTPAVAETDPVIRAITSADSVNGLYPGVWVKLNGSRLTRDVRITKSDGTGEIRPTQVNFAGTLAEGTRVDFRIPPNVVPGPYYINVYSATGKKSPTWQFRIVAPPVTSSAESKASQLASIAGALQAILEQLKAQ